MQERTMSCNTISNERGIKIQKFFMTGMLGLNSLHMVFIVKKLNPLFQVSLKSEWDLFLSSKVIL